MKRILLCTLLAVGLSHGQSGALSWSIYQVVLTNSTVAAPFTSPVFRNVGQTTSEVVVTFLPNPTRLCTGNLGPGSTLEFSYDGVTYVNFGVRINTSVIPNVFIFVGTGAYPRVRFFIDSYDNVNCNITVNYSGATTNPYTQILGASGVGTSASGVPPVIVGGISDGNLVSPLVACNNTVEGTVASGTTSLVVSAAVSNSTTRICSIVLDATGAGVTTIAVTSGNQMVTPCDSSLITGTPITLLSIGLSNTNPPMTYGNGLGSVLVGQQAGQVCITATGGAATYSLTFARLPVTGI